MNLILQTRFLAPEVKYFRIEAPKVARRCRAGQFPHRSCHRQGRADSTHHRRRRSQRRLDCRHRPGGRTTRTLNLLEAGDTIHDLVGPLGMPSEIHGYGTAVVVGGGVGTAIAYPTAAALAKVGNDVIAIMGGKSREFVILEEEMRAVCTEVHPTTDDGSYGYHGFVTDKLGELITAGRSIDHVMAAGPVPMMRAVAEVTRPHGIETVVSLNPIMVDGTGMCGGCRVSVGGATRFACVDGPEFDAHLVDFELLQRRNTTYGAFEHYRNEELTAENCNVRVDLPGAG